MSIIMSEQVSQADGPMQQGKQLTYVVELGLRQEPIPQRWPVPRRYEVSHDDLHTQQCYSVSTALQAAPCHQ